jgi:hypothetical protein
MTTTRRTHLARSRFSRMPTPELVQLVGRTSERPNVRDKLRRAGQAASSGTSCPGSKGIDELTDRCGDIGEAVCAAATRRGQATEIGPRHHPTERRLGQPRPRGVPRNRSRARFRERAGTA